MHSSCSPESVLSRRYATILWLVAILPASSLAQQPQISRGGVVSAASFSEGAISPGSIISIFGTDLARATARAQSEPLPRDISRTRVLINGQLAPLFFVSPNQINAQVPWETAGQPQAIVTVAVADSTSPPASITLHAAAPSIFAVNESVKVQSLMICIDSLMPATRQSSVQRPCRSTALGWGRWTISQPLVRHPQTPLFHDPRSRRS